MFRPTDSQLSLMESRFLVPPQKRARLERSWAEAFRVHVLPLIKEEVFRSAFCEDNGRPNKSIRLLVGVHLLKEADDLTDEQVVDALEFNIQWQHALGVRPEDAHVAVRTLYNFRRRLMEDDRAQTLFQEVVEALMNADGLSAARQRLDSTHVISNIRLLTRLGLFTETVTCFLRDLKKEAPEKLAKLPEGYSKRYLDREGYFSDAKREQAQRRMPVVAQDLYALVRAFELDKAVLAWPSYQLLQRLLDDQCEVTGGSESEPSSVKVKEPREVKATSLQSPHDPDATYGHKGKGYEVQIAETCVKENSYQIITDVRVNGAHESDQQATVPIVEDLHARGIGPEELLADTGYGSGDNIVQCQESGTELVAPVQDPHAAELPEHWERAVEPKGEAVMEPEGDAAMEAEGDAATEAEGDAAMQAEGDAAMQAEGDAATEAEGDAAMEAEGDAAMEAEGEEPGGKAATAAEAAISLPEGQGPTAPLGLDAFTFNGAFDEVVACPAGEPPTRHSMNFTAVPFQAHFDAARCSACPFADRCPTRLNRDTGERIFRWRDVKAATAHRQKEQQQPAFKGRYRLRSGIESTNAELKGRHGARKLRVRRKARVDLSLVLKAMSLNTKRAVQYHTRRLQEMAEEQRHGGV